MVSKKTLISHAARSAGALAACVALSSPGCGPDPPDAQPVPLGPPSMPPSPEPPPLVPPPTPPASRPDAVPFLDGDWHPGVRLRAVGDKFDDRISLVVAAPNGNLVALHELKNEHDNYLYASKLETFNPAGHLIASLPIEGDTFVIGLVAHPSGEFTAVEVRPGLDDNQKDLWLRRMGSDLRTLREAQLLDRPPDRERLFYEFDRRPDGSFGLGEVETMPVPDDGVVRAWLPAWLGGRHMSLAARGEEALLGTWSYGTKVYAIDANLGVRWSRQVMPMHGLMTGFSGREVLAVDDAGRAVIAFPVDKESVNAYKAHFGGGDATWSGPSLQTMVTRISDDGQEATSRLFAHEHNFYVAGVGARGDDVMLCGSANVKGKVSEPNNTSEWDIAWLSGGLGGGPVQTHAADLWRDDYAFACGFDASGGVFFAGVTDFVQVDTNSWVDYGAALFYGADARGVESSRLTPRGPRHTEVLSFARAADGTIVFGGSFDGPITHTPPAEASRKAMLGVYAP